MLNLKNVNLTLQKSLFLGYILSKDGLKVDPEKVKAILDWPVPSNVRKYNHLLDYVIIIEFLSRILLRLRGPYINLPGKMFHFSGVLINKNPLIN